MDLVHALERAASAIPSVRQAGESELRSLESQPGFYSALLSVYSDNSLANSSRSLAVIYLKNAVERKWRRANDMSADEKLAIRSRILEFVVMPATISSKQLSKQLALVVASIARVDFPRNWPQLLSDLNQMIMDVANQGNVPALNSLLEVMHQTLKRLATARIGMARVQLNEFSVTNVVMYWEIYAAFGSYQALKIVGTLLYGGHDRAHRFEGPRRVFGQLLPSLQSGNHVERIGKIYERLLDKNPLVFTGFGADAVAVGRFYCDYLNSRPTSGPTVQAMVVIRELTRLVKTSDLAETSLPLNLRPRDDQDRKDLQDAYALCNSLFDGAVVLQLTSTLIEYFFFMTEEDVELWRDDPSEFVVEEARQNPEFSVVLCAELLFAHLLKAWPGQVTPRAQELIEQAVHSNQELAVEAALRALQFGAQTFSKSFNVVPIIRLMASNPSHFIRRRLCLVAGGWIPMGSDEELQKLAFELVDSTLTNVWDVVVQLAALDLTKTCCDDMDFQPALFQIAANSVFHSVYELLQQPSQSAEVKLQVLHVLSTIIEGLDKNLSDADVNKITEILPALWEAEIEHSNHHLIQGAVLQTLAHLVAAKGSQNPRCAEVSIPLIQIATDPSQPISSYLLEDALNLWKALLLNLPTEAASAVVPLLSRLVALIECRTEYLATSLTILESYFWLDYEAALPYLDKLFGMFSGYLADGLALDEVVLILLCAEVLLIASLLYSDSAKVVSALQQSGLIQWMSNQLVYANTDTSMEVLIQGGKSLNVLSLVAISSKGEAVSGELFPSWLSRIRGIADPRDMKLAAIGLSAVLLAHPQLVEQWAEKYARCIGQTLEEVPDTLQVAAQPEDELTEEEKRRAYFRFHEYPVTVALQTFVFEVSESLRQKGWPQLDAACHQMGLF